jgi:hypothetical protein
MRAQVISWRARCICWAATAYTAATGDARAIMIASTLNCAFIRWPIYQPPHRHIVPHASSAPPPHVLHTPSTPHPRTALVALSMQAIEEAISLRLSRVEAGAQGEHKLSRGYLPTLTYSSVSSWSRPLRRLLMRPRPLLESCGIH